MQSLLVRGGRLLRIKAIQRLMFAASNMTSSTSIMEHQIQRSKMRLDAGVDLKGAKFAPYKEDRPTNNSRPLAHASRLWDDARYSYSRTLEGFEMQATITGRAATIAIYQNVKRRFVGFSDTDKGEAMQGLVRMLREAMKHGFR